LAQSPVKVESAETKEYPVTPQPVKGENLEEKEDTPATQESTPTQQTIIGGVKPEKRKYRRTLDENGKPKKNFYNPPGKVLRHLAQQTYYDNFYGSQQNYYALKQKYKTQMCKHYLNKGDCPLNQYCQFAHGPAELRQPNDVSDHLFFFILTVFLILATSPKLWKNRPRRCSLQLQDYAVQNLR
jgi:hypothetical protein